MTSTKYNSFATASRLNQQQKNMYVYGLMFSHNYPCFFKFYVRYNSASFWLSFCKINA